MEKTLLCALIGFSLSLDAFAQSTDTLFKASVGEIMKLPIAEKEEETVTTASKKAETVLSAPAVMTVITSKEIEAFGALNLGEVLDRVTGMYNAGSFYTPQGIIAVRGTITTHYNVQILFLLNGRPLREPLNNGFLASIYRVFPIDDIERIEIVRGTGSVLYGSNAYKAVINVITKNSEKDTEASGKLYYGSLDTWQVRAFFGKKIGKLELKAHIFWNKSAGWDYWARDERSVKIENGREIYTADPRTIKMKDDSKSFLFQAQYKNLKAHYLGIESQNNEMSVNSIWSAPPIHHANRVVQHFADITYKKQRKKWDFNAHLDYNYMLRQLLISSNFNPSETDHWAHSVMGEVSLAYKASEKLSMQAGATALYSVEDIVHFYKTRDGGNFNIYTKTNADPFIATNHESEMWYSAYFQASYKPFSFLNLDLGGQFNKTASPKWDFVPRANAIFHWKEKLFFKLMYGQAFRSPSLFERYISSKNIHSAVILPIIGGGIGLLPEKISSAQIQLAYKHRLFQVTATLFDSHESNLIIRSLPSDSLVIAEVGQVGKKLPFPKYINRGNFDSQGFELEGKITLARNIYLTTSYAIFKVGNGTVAQPTFGMPNNMLKTGISYESKKGITIGVFDSYFGAGDPIGRFSTVNPPTTAFHYLTANIRFNLRVFYGLPPSKGDFIIEIYGNNLLNESINYAEYVRRQVNAFPGRAGTAFYASLKYNFWK